MKQLLIILLLFTFSACYMSYPTTSFYVKNVSNTPIAFSATVMKQSQTMGPHSVNQSFVVNPQDSVLARRIGFKKDGENPQGWFTNFFISPIDDFKFNDPKNAGNWKKSVDKNGRPTYTFILTK